MIKKIFKTFGEVEGACAILSNKYEKLKQIDFIVGVSRGGLIPAAIIATILNKPLVAAYINKQDEVFFDRGEWIKGKKVMIIDDIVRTGKTMKKIIELIKKSEPLSIDCTVLGMIGDCDLNVIKQWSVKNNENIIFPWDFDFKN